MAYLVKFKFQLLYMWFVVHMSTEYVLNVTSVSMVNFKVEQEV